MSDATFVRTFQRVEIDKPVRFVTEREFHYGDIINLQADGVGVYGQGEVFYDEGLGAHPGEHIYHAKRIV